MFTHKHEAMDDHQHNTVAEAHECEDEFQNYLWESSLPDPDLAYERHLEDAGYDEARAQEDYEARMGVIDFQDAWCLADPTHVPYGERVGA